MSTAKAKTSLACDRCRQRKSRCDGTRPSCSHCVAAGAECLYRPTPTSLETDVSVLSRLQDVERRLASLEGGDVGASPPGSAAATARPPVLHTASGHQMLHSWPRVRVHLTVPEFEPLGFLGDADVADPFPRDTPETLQSWQLVRPAVDFYNELNTQPAPLVYLFQVYDEFGRERILQGIQNLERDATVELRGLTVAQLIVFSMALWTYGGSLGDDGSTVSATSRATFACLKYALDKQWTLLTANQDRVVLILALAYGLVYFWARPFHALGLLQSINPSIKRWSVRRPHDLLLLSCCKLHLILESDILTEIDEYGSDTILSGGDSAAAEALSSHPSSSQTAMDQDDRPSVSTYVDNHAWLRGHLNRVLHIYTPNKAYARPSELADLVAKLSAELRQWYNSQPLDRRFPRDATTFSMNNSSPTLHDKELAIRYFSCAFLLHRPVLYFFLHKDMEYSIQPPNSNGAASDHDPWVLESCRDCIESAALIVQFCGSGFVNNLKKSARSWCEYQLLFAAFLVILQVKGLEVFEPVFRNVGHAEKLLDRVEGTFELASMDSLILQRSLAVLQNVRRGFDAASPQYSR